jgi:dCMP deaminase
VGEMSSRISWEEYALKIAEVAALRSEDIHVQVGCCGLDHSNRVIGVAYNGLGAGINITSSFWLNRDARRPYVIHAEVNLLSLFKRNECRLLACTLLPCSSCASAIVAHGIKTVVYRDIYTRDEKALDIFKFNGIDCRQIKI